MLYFKKRAWAEISITALQYNMYKIQDKLPEGCKFMGVVKANAYGHGGVETARMLESFHCDYLGVACLDEAEQLREAGIELPILVLGATAPEFTERLVRAEVTQTLGSLQYARDYSARLEKLGAKLKIHVKLETGMGRTGFDVKDSDVSDVVKALALPGFDAEGIFTHCAVSDEPDGRDYTLAQFKRFEQAVGEIEKKTNIHFAVKHCANSGAVYNYPEMYLDMVRPGIALYGVYNGLGKGTIDCAPAMELKARIVQVNELEAGECVSYGCTFTADRKMRVAVVSIGYADGLHRVLSGKIDMLVHGERCRQVGRICMDMCMIDVTDIKDVKVGDIATVFGHDGHEVISVNELAEKAGTIGYEMLCGVSERVPRSYIG